MKREIWKDIPGYEGLYRVSSLGRVFSVRKNECMTFYNHHGYKRLKLYKDGDCRDWAVHRLVAIAFIPNPNNLPYINHKDLNRANNCVDNLEWCTNWYNQNYSCTKPVAQFTTTGELVAIYLSAVIASKYTGVDDSSIGCIVCGIKGRTAGGFIWKFAKKGVRVDVNNPAYFTGLPYVSHEKDQRKPIRKYDVHGNLLREYMSVTEAALDSRCHQGAVSNACCGRAKTSGGFLWCYADDTERIKEIESLRAQDSSPKLF